MITGLSLSAVALLTALGVLLDLMLGEVRKWHPLVGFGRLASLVERALNRGPYSFLFGMLAWTLIVVPFAWAAYWIASKRGDGADLGSELLHALLLYFCLGLRSLRDHTLPIEQALRQGDLLAARQSTARIVSRDTDNADASDLAKAGVESLLENGNDAVFGTIFWFVVAGGAGAVLFRLANTLDAMWGYRTSRFLAFGCAAARIDDALNWIPARLTALSYALLGNTKQAWHCWRTQAPQWSSPNAGPVMASGAGALGVALGGAASYEGVIESRPPLGTGHAAAAADIGRAWRLVANTTALWIASLAAVAVLLWLLERGTYA